jgi:hypothetical protein
LGEIHIKWQRKNSPLELVKPNMHAYIARTLTEKEQALIIFYRLERELWIKTKKPQKIGENLSNP